MSENENVFANSFRRGERRKPKSGFLEDGRLSGAPGHAHHRHVAIPRETISRRGRSQNDCGFQLRTENMTTKLKHRTVVICGGGFAAGLVARQLTAKNIDVVILERGTDHRNAAEAKLPSQRDELRWAVRTHLAQDWAVQTYSLRHSSN